MLKQAIPLLPQPSKKKFFTFVMGSMTVTAFYGCMWQYKKYVDSSKRWNTIHESLDNYQPTELKGVDAKYYPWYRNDNLSDWEYKLVTLQGYLKDERFFVRRTRDSRLGYLVFAPFITALESTIPVVIVPGANNPNEYGIMVNLGWVPMENKADITMESPIAPLEPTEDQEIEIDMYTELNINDPKSVYEDDQQSIISITGILRRSETRDLIHKKQNWPKEGVFTYIDLQFMSRFFRLFNLDSASEAYLERLVVGLDEDSEGLYPVPASKSNFDKPYLTPQRHRDYSMFWGSAGMIGIFTILSVIRK